MASAERHPGFYPNPPIGSGRVELGGCYRSKDKEGRAVN